MQPQTKVNGQLRARNAPAQNETEQPSMIVKDVPPDPVLIENLSKVLVYTSPLIVGCVTNSGFDSVETAT